MNKKILALLIFTLILSSCSAEDKTILQLESKEYVQSNTSNSSYESSTGDNTFISDNIQSENGQMTAKVNRSIATYNDLIYYSIPGTEFELYSSTLDLNETDLIYKSKDTIDLISVMDEKNVIVSQKVLIEGSEGFFGTTYLTLNLDAPETTILIDVSQNQQLLPVKKYEYFIFYIDQNTLSSVNCLTGEHKKHHKFENIKDFEIYSDILYFLQDNTLFHGAIDGNEFYEIMKFDNYALELSIDGIYILVSIATENNKYSCFVFDRKNSVLRNSFSGLPLRNTSLEENEIFGLQTVETTETNAGLEYITQELCSYDIDGNLTGRYPYITDTNYFITQDSVYFIDSDQSISKTDRQ